MELSLQIFPGENMLRTQDLDLTMFDDFTHFDKTVALGNKLLIPAKQASQIVYYSYVITIFTIYCSSTEAF